MYSNNIKDMTRTFNKDLYRGRLNEVRVCERLNDIMGGGLVMNDDPYGFYDIEDIRNKYFIEVKKRGVYKGDYNDYMFGLDKIERYIEKIKEEKYKDYKLIFVISCKCGDYYTLWNGLGEKYYNIRLFKRKNRPDKKDIEKDYVYISNIVFNKIDKGYGERLFKKVVVKKGGVVIRRFEREY